MNAREIALAVVRDVFPATGSHGRERGAQEALDYRTRAARASDRDRAFATELAYGAIKMRRTLDWYLAPLLGARAAPPPAVILEILRLAVYELAYTRADVHATVFEFVNLAKRYGHRGLGNLVNAVLRNFLRTTPVPPQRESFADADDFLATAYSLPTWLVRQWSVAFAEGTQQICAAVNDPARVALTANRLLTTRADLAQRLLAAGAATAPSALARESLLVESAGGISALEARACGAWWIQSESSAAVVEALDPRPGEAVLDVCSGRGNKALQIGARLGATGRLTCVERDPRKAEILTQRAGDAGVVAAVVVADATAWAVPEGAFDRVLLDVPCSGVGVVGRHPESRWKKRSTDGERLAVTQRALLAQSAAAVRVGGVLTYAVCSTDPHETTQTMQWFLTNYDFTRRPPVPALESFATGEGDVLIPPGIAGRDGFFIACVERR